MKQKLLAERYDQERDRLLHKTPVDPEGEYAAPVFGDGDVDASVLLIGEAPGAEETRMSRPFVGKAGKQLDDLLRFATLDRERLYITNVVKYRPVVRSQRSMRNRTPERAEVLAALPLLRSEIHTVSPKIIVTLGNTPLKAVFWLAGERPTVIGEAHGRPVSLTIEEKTYTLFPLYHPASGIYNRALVEVMEHDAVLLGEHLVKRDEFLQAETVL